jgi:hypothetical protein
MSRRISLCLYKKSIKLGLEFGIPHGGNRVSAKNSEILEFTVSLQLSDLGNRHVPKAETEFRNQ